LIIWGGAIVVSDIGFVKANSIQEIFGVLRQTDKDIRIIAGGTDVMPRVNFQMDSPDCFLYIGEVPLNYIKDEENKIIIGATTTLTEILCSKVVKDNLPMLWAAVSHMASCAVRNKGTIGGNICNASPAADTAVPLIAYNATIRISSENGERTVKADEFFKGPGMTVLSKEEIVKEIEFEKNVDLKWAYKKLGRRKADTLSLVSAGIVANVKEGSISAIRIALGAVAPVPVLAKKTAAFLDGKRIDKSLFEEAAKIMCDEISPINDGRSTASYKKQAAQAVVANLLEDIAAKI